MTKKKVVVLGCNLAFDDIEGFAEYGHTFTDTFCTNDTRENIYIMGIKDFTCIQMSGIAKMSLC